MVRVVVAALLGGCARRVRAVALGVGLAAGRGVSGRAVMPS
ncbi:hypothetical protein [Actinoallomurus iriomotensis]|nr:hypothetical protein [Actinoallomurus iriomotensis]